MAIYTVHEPPLREDESAPDPGRFVFVRDGFYFWAFLLTPLWMLRHRLWLVIVCFMLVSSAVNVVLYVVGASATVTVTVSVLVSLLAGFEAATLRRFTLSRRGFKTVGLVVGDDLESAERRFFEAWVKSDTRDLSLPSPPPPPPMSPVRRPQSGSDVIGLFPEPGAPR